MSGFPTYLHGTPYYIIPLTQSMIIHTKYDYSYYGVGVV
jgi:hypothetical protein